MRALGLALVALLLSGCRLPYDLPGISGVAPYDGGYLVSDQRLFEGSVGLWYVEDGRATDLPGCSTGAPRLVDGWVRASSGPGRRDVRAGRPLPDEICNHSDQTRVWGVCWSRQELR